MHAIVLTVVDLEEQGLSSDRVSVRESKGEGSKMNLLAWLVARLVRGQVHAQASLEGEGLLFDVGLS